MALVAFGGFTPMRFAGKALKWLWGKNKPIAITVVGVIGFVKIRSYIKKQERRKKWNAAGTDVVVLHIFDRGYFCPSLSPFVIKLETYLRMADIKYQVDTEEPLGPKGKSPWITLNGEDISDSQFIMHRLGAKFGKDFSSHLSATEKAVTVAFQRMMDEHFLWCLVVWRYDLDKGRTLVNGMPFPFIVKMLIPQFSKKAKAATKLQGIGRHSYQEVEDIGRTDLHALSTWLGEKQFMMGDKPSEVDCAVFGSLSQVVWNSPNSPYLKMLEGEFKNLYDYCQRMKNTLWPDWDKCLASK